MKSRSPLGVLRTAGALLALLLPAGLMLRASAQVSGGGYNYFPTGAVNDGKFLALAGAGSQTLSGDSTLISLSAEPGTSAFTLGVFDGDSGCSTNAAGESVLDIPGMSWRQGHWDNGPISLEYSLYADPRGDASGRFLIGRWIGNGGNGSVKGGLNTRPMKNNGWYNFSMGLDPATGAFNTEDPTRVIPTGPEAKNPNGRYYYVLKVRHMDPSQSTISGFKLRSDATISVLAQAISLWTPMSYTQELNILGTSTAPLGYDGTYDVNVNVPVPTSFLEVWNGDLDAGNSTGLVPQTLDTDDPDTPNALPLWAQGTAAAPEGIALSSTGVPGKGSPADDNSSAPHRRSPNIRVDVFHLDPATGLPSGSTWVDTNPSGNNEWERMLISTDPTLTRNEVDFSPTVSADGANSVTSQDVVNTGTIDSPVWRLKPGTYRVRIVGMDAGNLNAYRFFNDAVGVGPNGDPVVLIPASPVAVIGDYVWIDANRDNVQDAGETPVPGVKIEVLDATGNLYETVYTNLDGLYYCPVLPNATWTARVAASNFLPGGPLAGLTSTQNTNVLTRSVVTDDVLTYDFGYAAPPPATATLGDRVWLDADGNGVQDSGEAGIAGVTVRLLDSGGAVLDSRVTDADGIYLFTPLPAGTYTVTVDSATLPAGLTQTYDLDGLGTAHTANAGLADNQMRLDVDFGYKPLPATVGDRVWLDLNANGLQDSGETGVSGVTVNLLDNGSSVVATATTDGSGNYLFDNLAAGSYSVQFVAPAGYALTTANAGGDDALDSDANAAGNTATTTLAPGQSDLTLDAGIYPLGSLGDTVWKDPNSNGVQDSGEPGIPGITVNLLNNSDELVASTVTDANGHYSFPGLGPDTYRVVVVATDLPADANVQTYDLDGITTANEAEAILGAGQNRTDVDFGYKAAPASLGDRVWLDANANGVQDSGEAGVSGVTVRLLEGTTVVATTTTDGSGSYLFENLTPGSYSVQFVAPANYVLTGKDQGDDTADSDADAAGNTPATTLVAGESDLTLDAGLYPLGSIGDRVWKDTDGDGVQDSGETGISGVTVTLYDAEGDVVATTATDASGLYLFSGLEAGTYRVTVNAATLPATANVQTYDLDGLATPNTAQASLGIGQNRTDVDFGYKAAVVANASIGDRVWVDNSKKPNGKQDSGEPGKSGVTVKLLDASGAEIASTTTNSSGNYSFTNLVPGNYSVQFVAPAGYVFVPKDQGTDDTKDSDADTTTGKTIVTTLSAGENDLTWDAGLKQVPTKPASLGDKVWKDLNNNGVQDKGEPGVSGVTVKLLNESGTVVKTTTTDKSGVYSFTNLTPGNYSVQFVAPGSYGFTTKDAGSSNSKDSDVDPSTGKTTTITLTSGMNDSTWDAGLICLPGSLGDKVWSDTDCDGKQDSGEPGVAGVTVKLLTSKGSTIKTTTTGSDGSYSFTNLAAGSYVVQFVLPGGYHFTAKDQGTSNSADSDADPKTGKTTTITLDAGENDTSWDAGLKFTPACLGDRVWKDTDNDGVQDKGEKGVSGVTVKLLNSSGTVIATTTTDKNGNYKFSNLAPGSYKVKFVAPSGYQFAKKDQGSDTTDSDADTTSGETASVTLSSGENDTSVDAGLVASSGAKYTTYTQGGWGSSPSGNNPGTLLANNFDDLYKDLRIGDKRRITFTSASAVTNFLPAGGNANVLSRSHTNPTSTEAGVLAGQLTAATLNRDFSNAGITKSGLGSLKVQSGDLSGKTVNQVLYIANEVLGGDTKALPKGCSLSDLVNALTKINECFDNGTSNTGFLK